MISAQCLRLRYANKSSSITIPGMLEVSVFFNILDKYHSASGAGGLSSSGKRVAGGAASEGSVLRSQRFSLCYSQRREKGDRKMIEIEEVNAEELAKAFETVTDPNLLFEEGDHDHAHDHSC